MKPRRFALALSVLATGLGLAPQPAIAAVVPCSQDRKATLTLNEANTINEAAFTSAFRSESTKDLDLAFNVRGCKLISAQPAPEIFVRAIKDQKKAPLAALKLVTVDTGDGANLALTIQVTRSKLNAGTYGGAIEVRAPYFATNGTPITVSRTDELWAPPVVGAVGGLLGLAWFSLLRVVGRGKLQITKKRLIGLVVAAIAVGAAQALNAYWDQEVWDLNANGWAAGRAAFATASAGALAAVLATVWKMPPDEGAEGEAAEGEAAEGEAAEGEAARQPPPN